VDERGVRERFGLLVVHLDERSKRLWAGAEAVSLGADRSVHLFDGRHGVLDAAD